MKNSNKKNDLELKIYEALGVKQFRSLVFRLEKVIHHKDKGKNINYHVKRMNVDQLENFKKYLYFNGFIHVRNSILLSIIILVNVFAFSKASLAILILDLIKNLYCVMLQRYNYVRINDTITKMNSFFERRNKRREEEFKKSKSYERISADSIDKNIEQLENLKKFLQGTDDIIMDSDYKESLLMLREYFQPNKDTNQQAKSFSKIDPDNKETENVDKDSIIKRERKL